MLWSVPTTKALIDPLSTVTEMSVPLLVPKHHTGEAPGVESV